MGGKLGAVQVLEATEDLKVFSVEILLGSLRVSHSWVPQVLIEKGDIFFDRLRKFSIV